MRHARKRLIRRTDRDVSQQLRLAFQLAFVALNAWIGAQFYLWVRHFEGRGPAVPRPDGVEGWLPIAALMNLKAWLVTGTVPRIHPAGMFLLAAFLTISLLLRKSFCSWLCPVGTISEALWRAGRRLFHTNPALPRWLDVPLRGLKYLLFGFFAWAVAHMSAGQIAEFMRTPYGIIADVKLMNFFRFIGVTGAAVIAALMILSVVFQNFWCRYLCPYGALLGLAGLFSPARIRRNESACIDCAKCAKACPARLPVDTRPQIRSAECTLCMACVAVCPAKDALEVRVTPSRRLSPRAIAAAIAIIFLGTVAAARLSGHWHTDVPDEVYRAFVPSASQAEHPAP